MYYKRHWQKNISTVICQFTLSASPNISILLERTAPHSFSKLKFFSLLTVTRQANILPSPGLTSRQNLRRSTAHALLRTGSAWMSAPVPSIISATCFSHCAPSRMPPLLNTSLRHSLISPSSLWMLLQASRERGQRRSSTGSAATMLAASTIVSTTSFMQDSVRECFWRDCCFRQSITTPSRLSSSAPSKLLTTLLQNFLMSLWQDFLRVGLSL